MNYNQIIDIIAWFCVIYWIVYIPENGFSIDTNPFLATIAIIILIWRCGPYIFVFEEFD